MLRRSQQRRLREFWLCQNDHPLDWVVGMYFALIAQGHEGNLIERLT